MAFLMYAEFAAIIRLPVCVQVHDHRVLPVFIIAETVEVPAVETSFRIQRIVELISSDTSIASLV
jgi:hypothetical protein